MVKLQKVLTLVDLLCDRALNQPDKKTYTFLQDGETEAGSLTYQELAQLSQVIAAYLQSLNATGERVLLLYPPGLEFIAGFFGCLSAGAIAVPVAPPRLDQSVSRLQAIAASCQATVAFTTTSLLAYLQERFAETDLATIQLLATDSIASNLRADWQEPTVSRDTLAYLQYTSGSTGAPKGVMISHGNLLYNLAMMHEAYQFTPNSRTISWMPLNHNSGLVAGVLQPLYEDSPVTLMSPLEFLQKPLRWLTAISRYQATKSSGPNFAYDLTCHKTTAEQRASLDLSSWELAINGAEPVRAETIERFTATFAPCGFRREAFQTVYGMAESVVFISTGKKANPPVIHKVEKAALEQNRVAVAIDGQLGTQSIVGCGRTWLEQKILIVNPESLSECPEGQVGEIWVSSPSVAQGYWDQPEAIEQFRAYLADTGDGPFLRTGDLGFLLDGELFVTGRLKDLIIIRGRNHYPQDIELTVEKSHQALRPSCGAAFLVDVENKERLVIAQEIQDTDLQKLDMGEVIRAIRQAVSQQHELQVYAVLLLNTASIPKTSSGKIQRHACRVGFLAGSLDVAASNIQEEFHAMDQAFLERKALMDAPPEKRKPLLKFHLQHLISAMLKVVPSLLNWQQPLSSMGLDSLMVVELTSLLESRLGCSLRSTLVFEYPTVEALVDYLVEQVLSLEPSESSTASSEVELQQALSSSLVAMQSGGSKRPFFCVPGNMGTASYLYALALHLGCDQPFYGLQLLGVDGAELYTRVEDIAAHYIEALQTVQPQGPYSLGGHCFGGVVAFEMAQQLQTQGHEVVLALLDALAPLPGRDHLSRDWDDSKYMVMLSSSIGRQFGENLAALYDTLVLLSPEAQLDYLVERAKQLKIGGAWLNSEAMKKQIRGFVKVMRANSLALADYVPQKVHPTQIVLFRASEIHPWDAANWLDSKILKEPDLGWGQLAMQSVKICSVLGDHVTMLAEPHVQILAKQLSSTLSEL